MLTADLTHYLSPLVYMSERRQTFINYAASDSLNLFVNVEHAVTQAVHMKTGSGLILPISYLKLLYTTSTSVLDVHVVLY